jgi:50S ribosomal subunit-associated GTPase HflX
LIFHVVDASDPKIQDKIEIVDDILEKIWAKQDKIYVFNKIDLVDNLDEIKEKFDYLKPIFISTHKKLWLLDLKDYINKYF